LPRVLFHFLPEFCRYEGVASVCIAVHCYSPPLPSTDVPGGSKWEHIRGFHVFRHSFASNLAAAGVDQRMIDEWMGHQTEAMRKRYRHLLPDQRRKAIEAVFAS
jgi:integrase